jgi:hypothetical protein
MTLHKNSGKLAPLFQAGLAFFFLEQVKVEKDSKTFWTQTLVKAKKSLRTVSA